MATNIYLGLPPPNVVKWIQDEAERKVLKTPLRFTANEDNSSVSLVCYDSWYIYGICDSWCKFEYSMTGKDNDWSEYTTGQVITLNKDETVYFRCPYEKDNQLNKNKNGLCQYEDYGDGWIEIYKYHYFVMEGSIKADGNIQFLLDKTGTKMDVPEYCYLYMFQKCTSLTKAPALPVTTLAKHCYQNMFSNCSSLTQAPELPATTLADYCYYGMFSKCTSLTQAPALPAETLTSYCYGNMFYDCTSLNNINVSFSDWCADLDATRNWFVDVASEGTFTCPAALPDTPRDVSHIPSGWERADKQ